jgi:uncharacterized DUF497 family protein
MIDEEFEWDDDKAQTNLTKHGVSFEDARLVFQDAFAVYDIDISQHYDEERLIVVGMAIGSLLLVVHTERGERTRIISARRATKREQDDYYQDQTSF